VDLVGRAGRDRVALANREAPADLEAPANREAPADLEAPAAPEDRADLAGPEGMSRAARAATADMGLVVLANRVAPANPVDPVVLADLVGMSPVVQADQVAPANLVGMSPVVQANRVVLAGRDPGQNRALMDRNPVHPRRAAPTPAQPRRRLPDPMRAHPHLTRAHPHLTPARPQEQTRPEGAAPRPVPIHPAGETHLAEVIRPVEATHEADTEGVTLHYREFCSQSHSFGQGTPNCIGARRNS
jgi:hypothetical protein